MSTTERAASPLPEDYHLAATRAFAFASSLRGEPDEAILNVQYLIEQGTERDAAEQLIARVSEELAFGQMTPEEARWFILGATTQALTVQYSKEAAPNRTLFTR